MSAGAIKAVLLDVDGTLVDSNDAHAHAWTRAFGEHGIDVPFDVIRRAIGMGGDHLMPTVSDLSEESEQGQQIATRRKELFSRDYLPHIRPLRDADRLIAALKARGLTAVAASSAKEEELKHLLTIAGADDLLDAATSNDDADSSKPEPDIIVAALKRAKVQPEHALMVGDTPYDIDAARRAGVQTIAFRSGGWSDEELRGAVAIYDGPWDLLAQIDTSPLAGAIT